MIWWPQIKPRELPKARENADGQVVIGFRCAALLIGKGDGAKFLDQSKQSFMTFDTHLNIADWLVRWTLDRKVWVQALTGSLCCVPELNTLIPKCLYLPPPPHSPLKSINALCWTLKKPDTPRANDLLGDYPEVLRAVDKHPIQRVEGGGGGGYL